jgi:DNA (cytosine-5)-methyltransferase 1
MQPLVLSLFPGIGLLDRAFEEEGFCVVRGPDLLWGGDVRRFHPPAHRFEGIIGGPPCQLFSTLRRLRQNRQKPAENLIPEFERVVSEARPSWYLMENVPAAPEPSVFGYQMKSFVIDARWIGMEQRRRRRICFGSVEKAVDLRREIELVALENFRSSPTVCASGVVRPGMPRTGRDRLRYHGWKTTAALKESLRLQGLPPDFLKHAPFTLEAKHKVIGNGVPLPLGIALARAVYALMYPHPY